MFFDRTLTNPAITPGDGHRPLVVEGKDENDLGENMPESWGPLHYVWYGGW